jgi:hypothetical protein
MDSGLFRRHPFMIWEGARVSRGGVPCAPLPPMTLLSRGLIARIQKRIFLGRPYAMGFDWQPCTLLSSMGGVLDIRYLHPRAAPLFHLFGILMGSSSFSSPSPHHRGGSSFSSSPVGITRATAGSLHRPPILGGLGRRPDPDKGISILQ